MECRINKKRKGFYGMSFTLSLFAAVAVQKNIRDSQTQKKQNIKITELEN